MGDMQGLIVCRFLLSEAANAERQSGGDEHLPREGYHTGEAALHQHHRQEAGQQRGDDAAVRAAPREQRRQEHRRQSGIGKHHHHQGEVDQCRFRSRLLPENAEDPKHAQYHSKHRYPDASDA